MIINNTQRFTNDDRLGLGDIYSEMYSPEGKLISEAVVEDIGAEEELLSPEEREALFYLAKDYFYTRTIRIKKTIKREIDQTLSQLSNRSSEDNFDDVVNIRSVVAEIMATGQIPVEGEEGSGEEGEEFDVAQLRAQEDQAGEAYRDSY